jgi:hypothetical protein
MSNLMTEEEYDLFSNMNAPHGKWFVPLMWMLNLIKREKQKNKIDSVQLKMLLEQLFKVCLSNRVKASSLYSSEMALQCYLFTIG